jgi:hypothetical protein
MTFPDLNDASLMEAARDLLAISNQLNPDQTVDDTIEAVATALEVLAGPDPTKWLDYTPIVREVMRQESTALGNGDPAEYFNSPDALIEAINEERAQGGLN